MLALIKWEIKKNIRPGVLVIWAIGLFLGLHTVFTNFGANECYAAIFDKYYLVTVPIMGLMMFTMFAGNYTREYHSNVADLIKASKNGKQTFVLAKFIASGICASVLNLSILYAMVGKAVIGLKFAGLQMPLKELWYFGNSHSDLTVLQMLVILSLTVILGSFTLAAIGLCLSALSKNAAVPFILGGLTMAIPYWFVFSAQKEVVLSLLMNGMFSQQIVRYALPFSYGLLSIAVSFIVIFICYYFTEKAYLKER